jgi:hypothetical protein
MGAPTTTPGTPSNDSADPAQSTLTPCGTVSAVLKYSLRHAPTLGLKRTGNSITLHLGLKLLVLTGQHLLKTVPTLRPMFNTNSGKSWQKQHTADSELPIRNFFFCASS